MNTPIKRPRFSSLTALGFQINAFLEEGNHGVTFADIYEGLETGTLWEKLKARIPNIDVGIYTSEFDQGQGASLHAVLLEVANSMRDREHRKYGIESGGLSLLLAYILEAIQQGFYVDPKS